MSSVIVRFPPSPTGHVHVGNVRTILYNYLFAKQHAGKIIFRSEDTDRARSTREFEESNCAELSWLGLSWDEFHRQSERTVLYTEQLTRLIDNGAAYLSKEESKMNPGTEAEVIRLKNPNTTITFDDVVRGAIVFDTTELGDIVLARAIDDPVYQFAVVVDDALMGITHVIRGEDHISNTPRQILIQEALGFARPIYAHLPILLGEDRTKLSKRHGSVSLHAFHEQGYLPEALVNYLALLGWSGGDDRELYSLEELIDTFDLTGVHKGGAIFSQDKLNWFNQHYIRQLTDLQKIEYLLRTPGITPLAKTMEKSQALREDILERITHHGELTQMIAEGEFDFLGDSDPIYPTEALLWKKDPDPMETARRLAEVARMLDTIHEDHWSVSAIKDSVWQFVEAEGKGNVLWPLRYALSGRDRSPDPFTLAEALGKETTLRRIATAHSLCSALH